MADQGRRGAINQVSYVRRSCNLIVSAGTLQSLLGGGWIDNGGTNKKSMSDKWPPQTTCKNFISRKEHRTRSQLTGLS